MQDVAEWLPKFLSANWDKAVASLRGDGVDVVPTRPQIFAAHTNPAGGDIMAGVVVKVRESGDLDVKRTTFGDADRDLTWPIILDVKRKANVGGAARKSTHDAIQVLVRLLELHRSEPQADWNRVEDVHVTTIENYPDYQHRTIEFTLKRYGQPMVTRIYQVD